MRDVIGYVGQLCRSARYDIRPEENLCPPRTAGWQ